eukprot:7252698-Prymnesium_polylepis.1
MAGDRQPWLAGWLAALAISGCFGRFQGVATHIWASLGGRWPPTMDGWATQVSIFVTEMTRVRDRHP